VGPLILETILALPNVVAVVWAGIPGQESGNGLVDILYGSTAPSGKLPFTIAKLTTDYNTALVSASADDYPEGLFIDYRHFDKSGIVPRYEFGFGLSYTTFAYSALTISSLSTAAGSTTTIPGGTAGLYAVVATVGVTITNNGTVTGAEVPQLYIGLPSSAPSSPPKQLRGFDKLTLAAGANGAVTFNLRRKDLSYWDTTTQAWVLPAGTFTVSVGASSRDIRLTGTLVSSSSSSSGSGSSGGSSSSSSSSTTSKAASSSSTGSSASKTTTSTSTTTTTASGATQTHYGQCGGVGWTGPTACASPYTCTYSSAYYSQCL
jgi:beta-glucosidase